MYLILYVTEPQNKIDFQMRLCFTCDASWVSVPKYLELMYMVRNITVSINPSGLHCGVHTTT